MSDPILSSEDCGPDCFAVFGCHKRIVSQSDMSSWRNAVKDKVHKERSQPIARQSLGLLEKKKDYKIRANYQHKKDNLLREYKLKAALKNPDEFNTRMISLARGHTESKEELEKQMLEKDKDSRILNAKRVEKEKKIERLVGSLQFMDNSVPNNHTIFVDDQEEMENWTAAKYFNTLPELVQRKYNRLSPEQLKDQAFASTIEDEKDLKKMKKRRETRYQELAEALDDQETVDRVMSHIDLRRNLQKGKAVKVADGVNGHADVYKWDFERKK